MDVIMLAPCVSVVWDETGGLALGVLEPSNEAEYRQEIERPLGSRCRSDVGLLEWLCRGGHRT